MGGYRSEAEVRADVYDAALAEERDPERASRLTDELVAAARRELAAASDGLAVADRLRAVCSGALAELRAHDIVVLEAVDDHWTASATLETLAAAGRHARGASPTSRCPTSGTPSSTACSRSTSGTATPRTSRRATLCSTSSLEVLGEHRIPAVFDEGRIEATLAWQRRPGWTPTVMSAEPVVGVLALQGDVREHLRDARRLWCARCSQYGDLPSWTASTPW